MKVQVLFCLVLTISLAMVQADQYEKSSETNKKETSEQFDSSYNEDKNNNQDAQFESDEETTKPKKNTEDVSSETSSLVQQDERDARGIVRPGFCQSGVGAAHKRGFVLRCGCLRCTCANGGNWLCRFNFAFCPFYYCGGRIMNPATQVCCCGKVHDKRRNHKCCGVYYYFTRRFKCCKYYSVKQIKANCPRFRI